VFATSEVVFANFS